MDPIDRILDLPWTWLAIRASGLIAWAGLSATVTYGLLLRTRLLTRASGANLAVTHRWLGSITLAALIAHLGVLLVDPVVTYTPLQLLIPYTADFKPTAIAAGQLAMWALVMVLAVSRARTRLGKNSAKLFNRTHKIAYAAWPLATAHYILAGTDALQPWSVAALAATGALITFALLARGNVPFPERKSTRTSPPAGRRSTVPVEANGGTKVEPPMGTVEKVTVP